MKKKKAVKWRSILGLLIVLFAILFNLTWLWAVLFLFWIIPDLFTGTTYFMELIKRRENPVLYWAIMFTWLFTSVYILIDSFVPQLLPTGWTSYNSKIYQTNQTGIYQIDPSKHKGESKELDYTTHVADAFHITGISAKTGYTTEELSIIKEELWAAFLKEDIAQSIPDILDDKIYLVYSDYAPHQNDAFQLTIGYKTASLDNIYKGLTGITVEAASYAVFELTDKPIENINFLWEKITLSDLKTSATDNIEVYHYNPTSQEVEQIDIWVAIPDVFQNMESLKAFATPSNKNPILLKETKKPAQAVSGEVMLSTSPELYPSPAAYQTVPYDRLHIVGLQATANYMNKEKVVATLEQLWNDFLARNYSKYIDDILDKNQAYIAYTNYTEQEVTITLGYKTKPYSKYRSRKNLHRVLLSANDYYTFPLAASPFGVRKNEWNTLIKTLPYRKADSGDFEVMTLDEKYNIINTQFWVGAK